MAARAAQFPAYAVLDDLENHLYVKIKNDITNANFTKVVSKHLDLIRDEVPSDIFFRSSTSRIDLHRFLIIGAPGTIYYNSYFLFDMMLPNDYPNVQPKVTMHAFSVRVNPNLYDNGYVCLSLLGTWKGNGLENWAPESSNLLQVAKSIQGLVLGVEEPYYNEPGYVMRARDDPVSLAYSQNALILSLTIMVNLVKTPPVEFAEIVRDHFKSHCLETKKYLRLLQTKKEEREVSESNNEILRKFRLSEIPTGHWERLKKVEAGLDELIGQYGPTSRTLRTRTVHY